MSSIVADILNVTTPSLERVASTLEAARDAPQAVRDGLLAAIERAEREVVPGLQSSIAAMEQGLKSLEAAVETPTRRRRSRPASGVTAPLRRGKTPA